MVQLRYNLVEILENFFAKKNWGSSNKNKVLMTNNNGEVTTGQITTSQISDLNIPEANTVASNIKMNGSASAGNATTYAKADHIHPSDTNKSKVSFTRNLTSGTKIGSITIDNNSTEIFCEKNTNYTASDGITITNGDISPTYGTTSSTIAEGNHVHKDFTNWGTVIPSGAKLNDYKTPGFYYQTDWNNTQNIDNIPDPDTPTAFCMLIEKQTSGGVKQTYTKYNIGNPKTFVRVKHYSDNTWGDWQLIPYVSDIGTESGRPVITGSNGKITKGSFGTTSGTFAQGNHTHGNLQTNGQVGSTAQANYNVVTDSNGKITTEAKPSIPSASSTTPLADTSTGAIGSGTTWARADHKHPLSSSYATNNHNHGVVSNTGYLVDNNGDVVTGGDYNKLLYVSKSSGKISGQNLNTSILENQTTYNNIKDGESTNLTLTTQKKINDAVNTKLGSILEKPTLIITDGTPTPDLNNYKTPGFYWANSNWTPSNTSLLNAPVDGKAFTLLVDGNNDTIRQFATLYKTQNCRTFVRMFQGFSYNEWSEWKEFSFTGDNQHTHGQITSDGKIGSTANKPIITTSNGVLTTGSFGTTANTFAQGNHVHTFGTTAGTYAQGNHTHNEKWKLIKWQQDDPDNVNELPTGIYLFYNSDMGLCYLIYYREFTSLGNGNEFLGDDSNETAWTKYKNWVPEQYRPVFQVQGSFNYIGSIILTTSGSLMARFGERADVPGVRGTLMWMPRKDVDIDSVNGDPGYLELW